MDVQSLKRQISSGINNSEGNKRLKLQQTTLQSLPKDVLLNIFGRVASSSLIDLFNTKLCCKDFVNIGEDDHIYKCISMETIGIVSDWKPIRGEEVAFKAKCLKEGNPEALYRQGMLDLFGRTKYDLSASNDKVLTERMEIGLRFLKTAANNGHQVAKYVCGMILLSQTHEEAFEMLTSLKSPTQDLFSTLEECRKKMRLFLGSFWIRGLFSYKIVPLHCHQNDHVVRVRREGFEEFVDYPNCDICIVQYSQEKFSQSVFCFVRFL